MAGKARKSSGDEPSSAEADSTPSTPSTPTTSTGKGGKPDVTSKDLATRLADPDFQRNIERAVRELPPERAAELVAMLEASIKRRKLELYGYVAAAIIVLLGLVGGLLVMGSAKEGSFIGWIFFIPIGLAGLVMWLVGKKARAAQKGGPSTRPSARRPSS